MSERVVALSLRCDLCDAALNLSTPGSRVPSIEANWQAAHAHPRAMSPHDVADDFAAPEGESGCALALIAAVFALGCIVAWAFVAASLGN